LRLEKHPERNLDKLPKNGRRKVIFCGMTKKWRGWGKSDGRGPSVAHDQKKRIGPWKKFWGWKRMNPLLSG